MNIIVTTKQVADPNLPPAHMQLDPAAKRVISPFGVPPVMNGYDANALEEALRLKQKHGGRVTALALGDDTSRIVLKRAVAMGADAAILLNDPDWLHADSAGVGRVLAAAMRKVGNFDLVLCGRQASDTDGGQVLYWIAEALELPVVSPVIRIESDGGRDLIAHRIMDDGVQQLRVGLPALLGISSEINEPRLPTMRGTMAAGRAMIPAWKAGDLGLATLVPKIELRRLEIQSRIAKAELLGGKSGAEQGVALADKLHELGVI